MNKKVKAIIKENQLNELKVSYMPQAPLSDAIQSSRQAHEFFRKVFDKDTIGWHETLKVVLLARNNKVKGVFTLGEGGQDAIIADVRMLFQVALLCGASYVILAHNHPSGSLKPSPQDKMMTEKIYKAGQLLDIKLFDHLIIGPMEDDYFSFADNGLIG